MALLESIIIGVVCMGPVKLEEQSFVAVVDEATGIGESWSYQGKIVELHAVSDNGKCEVLKNIHPLLLTTRGQKPLVVWTELAMKIPY